MCSENQLTFLHRTAIFLVVVLVSLASQVAQPVFFAIDQYGEIAKVALVTQAVKVDPENRHVLR